MPASSRPLWQGEPLAGRTLLIRLEQGFGTNIQFCRYAAQISGGRVILEVYPSLRRLFASLRGVDGVVSAGEAPPPFDLYVPLMSLPRLLPPPPADAPLFGSGTLRGSRRGVTVWARTGSSIGVAWQGNPDSQAELGRSYPIACLCKLAALPGVRLISLQKHHTGSDSACQARAEANCKSKHQSWMPVLDAFSVDTAAVMRRTSTSLSRVGYVDRPPRGGVGATSGLGRLAACAGLALAART